MSKEVFVHPQFIWVFVFICCLVCYLLLSTHSLNSSCKCFLFVLDWFWKRSDPLLALEMVLIDESHKLLKSMLGLESLLFCFAVFVSFFVSNGLFWLVTLLKLLCFDLCWNEILMHPINHMLVAPLQHQLKVMCLLDILETITRCLQTICLLHILFFDIALFCLELFKFFLTQDFRHQICLPWDCPTLYPSQ